MNELKIKIDKTDLNTLDTFKNTQNILIVDKCEDDNFVYLTYKHKTLSKVFLGGSSYKTNWRNDLIKNLQIEYVNPTELDENEIEKEKENCDFVLYVITSLNSALSFSQLVESSIKKGDKTLFCILYNHENSHIDIRNTKTINKIIDLVTKYGAKQFNSLQEINMYLNQI